MFLKLSKLFFAALVMYFGWFQIVFFQVTNMLLLLGVLMMACIVLHAYSKKINLFKYITIELLLWLIFAFTSFVFGFLIARNRSIMISELLTFVEFLILIYGIIYISNQDKSIDFFINLFILFSIICSITTIFFGVEYSTERISMGINNNPNLLGIIMAIGVCCILYRIDTKKTLYSAISFFIIAMLFYTTILTGSRKSFLSIIIVLLFWLIFVVLKDIRKVNLKEIVLLALMTIIGYNIIYAIFQESELFYRLSDLFKSGDETRTGMYKVAFELFKRSPIIGIGFNNYEVLSGYGTYSHSTYAEALACTGIVGVVLYFSSYAIIIKKYYKLFFNRKLDYIFTRQSRMMLGLFFILLFLGIGVIHFYEMPSSIAFGMLIAFSNINKEHINAK